MIRTVVPPRRTADIAHEDDVVVRGADGARGTASDEPDGYVDKLVKYVPAEVLGGFVPLSALAAGTGHDSAVWVAAAAGLIGTPAYLAIQSRRVPLDKKPRPYFYLLSALAFLVWAVGTSSPLREVTGIGQNLAEFFLGLTVFLMPVLDAALEALFGERE